MNSVETGPVREALAAFQAECTSEYMALSAGNADSGSALSNLLQRLVGFSERSELAFSDDMIVDVMINGHLRRNEAVLALLLEKELRLLARSGPVTEVHINALTRRIKGRVRQAKHHSYKDVFNDDSELRAFKKRRYREVKADQDSPNHDSVVFITAKARKLSRARSVKQNK